MSIGSGSIYSGSWKQKMEARSLTESELVSVYDVFLTDVVDATVFG